MHLCHSPLDRIGSALPLVPRTIIRTRTRTGMPLHLAIEGQLIQWGGTERGRRGGYGRNNMVLFMAETLGVHTTHSLNMVIDLRCRQYSICRYSLSAIAGGGSEIGDDQDGDIVNIINSRSADERTARGEARIINTELLAGSLSRKQMCPALRPLAPFCFPP